MRDLQLLCPPFLLLFFFRNLMYGNSNLGLCKTSFLQCWSNALVNKDPDFEPVITLIFLQLLKAG